MYERVHSSYLRSWAVEECLTQIKADDQFTHCISIGVVRGCTDIVYMQSLYSFRCTGQCLSLCSMDIHEHDFYNRYQKRIRCLCAGMQMGLSPLLSGSMSAEYETIFGK